MASLLVLMLMTSINAVLAGSGTTASDPTLYCVVGSGPAGLQLARHFEDAGRNYVLFERGPSVATFYRKHVNIYVNAIALERACSGSGSSHLCVRSSLCGVPPDGGNFVVAVGLALCGLGFKCLPFLVHFGNLLPEVVLKANVRLDGRNSR